MGSQAAWLPDRPSAGQFLDADSAPLHVSLTPAPTGPPIWALKSLLSIRPTTWLLILFMEVSTLVSSWSLKNSNLAVSLSLCVLAIKGLILEGTVNAPG